MNTIITWLERLGLALAVLSVAAIMLIVSYDAFARYAFRAPLPWAFELIRLYLMLAAAYFALSSTFRTGDHIAVDLFRPHIPRAIRARLDAVWALMAALVMAIIAYGAWGELTHAIRRNEFVFGYIAWPAWPSYAPVFLGFALLTLRLVFHGITRLIFGEDETATQTGDH